jgi:hypothetical protein
MTRVNKIHVAVGIGPAETHTDALARLRAHTLTAIEPIAVELLGGEVIAWDDAIPQANDPISVFLERDWHGRWKYQLCNSRGQESANTTHTSIALGQMLDFLEQHNAGKFILQDGDGNTL